MSASGKYRRPAFRINEWFGLEKRRSDGVARLARELFEISKEATDPFELAAHLEALGFNNKRVKEEFALPDTFALARKLFHMSSRRPDLRRRSYLQLPMLGWRQLLILLAVVASIALQQTQAVQGPMVLWLISWSIVSSAVVAGARTKLVEKERKAIFTLLMVLGFLGIGLLALPNRSLAELSTAILWWSVTACIWLEDLYERNRYWIAGFILASLPILALVFIGTPPGLILVAQLGLSLFFFWPELKAIKLKSLSWLKEDSLMLLAYLAYALGFAFLLLRLIQLSLSNVWLASALLLLFLFLAEWAALGLKNSLADAMWISSSVAEYQLKSLSSSTLFLRYLLIFLVLTALLTSIVLFPELAAFISHFVLFGLSIVLVLMLFSLRQVLVPALVFMLAGLASFLALPLIWILVVLALVLVLLWFIQLQHVEDYGFHIIG